jgi:hypothetical protein
MSHRATLRLALLAAVVLAALPATAGDTASALGTWDLVAATPEGDMPSVLTLKDVDGTLKAEIELQGTKRTVSDEKIQDGVLTMRVQYEGTFYDVKAKIDGDAMDGTWSGGGNSGTLKAKRRP